MSMKKIFKDNLKKITALLLVGIMIMPLNSSVFAQDDIIQDIIDQDIIEQDVIEQVFLIRMNLIKMRQLL